MKDRSDLKTLQLALKAVNGRFNRAEAALAALVRSIREHGDEARECARLLATAARLEGDNAAFSAFADRRRDAIKARINALSAALDRLYTDKEAKKADVERYLRQKISLEAAADEIKREAAKAVARGV